jgi:type II secretory pathway pseudopilin PulG
MALRKLTTRNGTPRRRAGFTLIEAALTTVIIGVGCVAMLQLLGAGTVANGEGTQLTTAMNLAGNIRECLMGVNFADPTVKDTWGPEAGETLLTYDDLDDFDGKVFSPPIDARRYPIDGYAGWSQTIKIESVEPTNLTLIKPHLTLDPTMRPTSRVTVIVQKDGKTIYVQSWIAAYADPTH